MTAPIASPKVTWNDADRILTVTAPTGYRSIEWRYRVRESIKEAMEKWDSPFTVVVPTTAYWTSVRKIGPYVRQTVMELGWHARHTTIESACYITVRTEPFKGQYKRRTVEP